MTDRSAFLQGNRPLVMGVLNVTPDSFSDGGRYLAPPAARERARRMIAEGADIIDVGGESTRPGAAPVRVEEELARVVPVIEAIRAESDVPISVDTSKPEVMAAACEAGADMINDVRALREPGALETAARLGRPVCLMHMRGEPRTMQAAPRYDDVVAEVEDFLRARVAAAEAAGLPRGHLVIDPGFGFGKTLEHNLLLFRALPRLRRMGLAVLVGVSRKTMIGTILDRPPQARLHGSVALAGLAAWLGARIVRVHDVGATRDAVRVVQAVKEVGEGEGGMHT